MANFPTITSCGPRVSAFEESLAIDPTLRSPTEAGYKMTRAKFTRIPKKWTFFYPALSATDKGSLDTFQLTTVRVGADSFSWTNPSNTTSYTVRLAAPIVFRGVTGKPVWSAQIELEQV